MQSESSFLDSIHRSHSFTFSSHLLETVRIGTTPHGPTSPFSRRASQSLPEDDVLRTENWLGAVEKRLPEPEGTGVQMHEPRTFIKADPAKSQFQRCLAKFLGMDTGDQKVDGLPLHM